MSILSGYKKVKNYIETGSGKKLLSRWTSSNTVEFEDGKTAQTKMGAIKGITTSTSATETGYAADATTVAALNQSLSNIKVNWKLIGFLRANHGENFPDVKVFNIPNDTKTMFVVYEEKCSSLGSLTTNNGLTLGSYIIPVNTGSSRYYSFSTYIGSEFFGWGRIKINENDKTLSLQDFGCNYYNNTYSKPWISIYSI